MMDRRNALKSVALIMGGAVVGGELFLSGCKSKPSEVSDIKALFEQPQTAYMDEIAETILPKTSSPGAKDAKVGAFMAVMVRDCYTPQDQKTFLEGLKLLDDASEKDFKKSFMDITPEQRTQLLTTIDKEAKEFQKQKWEKESTMPKDELITGDVINPLSNHYFYLMKQLTLLGYFTSEPGATKALRYLPVPGKYEGNYPYKKGDKAWALS